MFIPKRVIFEKDSLDTEVGKNIYDKIKKVAFATLPSGINF